jgi:hypothetical protein
LLNKTLFIILSFLFIRCSVLEAQKVEKSQIGFAAGYAVIAGMSTDRPGFQVFMRRYVSQKIAFEASVLYLVEEMNEPFNSSDSFLPAHIQLVYSTSRSTEWPISFSMGTGVTTIFKSLPVSGDRTEISLEFVASVSVERYIGEHLALQPRFTVVLNPPGNEVGGIRYSTIQLALTYDW